VQNDSQPLAASGQPAESPPPARHLIRVTRHITETGYILAEPGSRQERDVLTGIHARRHYVWPVHERTESLAHTDLGRVQASFTLQGFRTQKDEIGQSLKGQQTGKPHTPAYTLLKTAPDEATLMDDLTQALSKDGLLRGVVAVGNELYQLRLESPRQLGWKLAEAFIGAVTLSPIDPVRLEIVGVGESGLHIEVTVDAARLLTTVAAERKAAFRASDVIKRPLRPDELCDRIEAAGGDGHPIVGVVAVPMQLVQQATAPGHAERLYQELSARLTGAVGLTVLRYEIVGYDEVSTPGARDGHSPYVASVRVTGTVNATCQTLRSVAPAEPARPAATAS